MRVTEVRDYCALVSFSTLVIEPNIGFIDLFTTHI